ncbi:MAG: DUF2703 domain-containing protein, partial [Treponema sp.]|nr:DUF2703 domain-containing protein [Treponema sp.]
MKTDSVKKTSACCGSQAEPQASTCCGPEASSCCGSQTASCCNETKKTLNIDFLYLDLNTCERCIATDATLKEALGFLSCVFDTLGFEIKLNTVNITSKELAD